MISACKVSTCVSTRKHVLRFRRVVRDKPDETRPFRKKPSKTYSFAPCITNVAINTAGVVYGREKFLVKNRSL